MASFFLRGGRSTEAIRRNLPARRARTQTVTKGGMELALNTSLSPSFVASITFCFHPATQSSNISPTDPWEVTLFLTRCVVLFPSPAVPSTTCRTARSRRRPKSPPPRPTLAILSRPATRRSQPQLRPRLVVTPPPLLASTMVASLAIAGRLLWTYLRRSPISSPCPGIQQHRTRNSRGSI